MPVERAQVAETVWYHEDGVPPLTVLKPAAFDSGQVLVAVIVAHGGSTSDLTAPTGWSEEGSTSQATLVGKVFSHTYNVGDPGSWDFPYHSSADVALGLFRVTGADDAPLVAVATNQIASLGSSNDSPSITPWLADDLLITLLADVSGGTPLSETDPSGMTDLGQAQEASFMALAATSELLNSSAATGVRTWTSVSPTGQVGATFSIVIQSSELFDPDPPPNPPRPLVNPLMLRQLVAWRRRQLVGNSGPEDLDLVDITWYNEDSSPPLTVNRPTGLAWGQLLIAVITAHGGTLADLTAPAGWTEQHTNSQATLVCKVFYHVFDNTEPATWDFGYHGSADTCLALFRIKGADPSPVIVTTSTGIAAVGSSDDSPSVTPTGNDDLLLTLLANAGEGVTYVETDPAAMTDLGQTQVPGNFMALAATKQRLASSAATGVRTWTSVTPTGNVGASFSIAIKSISGGTPPSGTPQTGSVQVGGAGSGTGVKVAAQTGSCTLGGTGSGSERKIGAEAAQATVGFAGTGVERKVVSNIGLSSSGLAGSGADRKVAPNAGRLAVGLTGGGTDRKVQANAGRSMAGFSGSGSGTTGIPAIFQTGFSAIGLVARANATKVVPNTGRSAVGLGGFAVSGAGLRPASQALSTHSATLDPLSASSRLTVSSGSGSTQGSSTGPTMTSSTMAGGML
jgi:hypothetical protein